MYKKYSRKVNQLQTNIGIHVTEDTIDVTAVHS